MRPKTRLTAGSLLALACLLLWTPSVSARDSTISFTLTLDGPVSPDLTFEVVTAPGVGGSNVFCVGKSWDDPTFPVCRTGVTYRTSVVLAPGESLGYQIHWILPRRPGPVLWSGTLTGDGRDHTRTYGFTFGLPATDTVIDTPSHSPSASAWWTEPRVAVAIVSLAAGSLVWLGARRTRRPMT
jgi:hypothetical protein